MSSYSSQAIGKITLGIAPSTLILKIIEFVYHKLPAWRDDPNRPEERGEDRLNLQLSVFLNSQARQDLSIVQFVREEPQTGSATVDMSALPRETLLIGAKLYPIYKSIVVFEGKRLPAPTNAREREYVTGGKDKKSGGIQRFKLGIHGADHDIAVMIGYIQESSPSYWHNKINDWITALSSGATEDICLWIISEVLGSLEEEPSKGTAACWSIHGRSGNVKSPRLQIRHLWIKMTA